MSEIIYLEESNFEFEKDGDYIRIACCDCGLVHNIGIAIEDNGKIGVAFERNNRSTGQLRRYRNYPKK